MRKLRLVTTGALAALVFSPVASAEDGTRLAHSVMEISGKTCITQLAHNQCKPGYEPLVVDTRSMAMVCLDSGTEKTEQLVRQAESGEVTALKSYPVALYSNTVVAQECGVVQVMQFNSEGGTSIEEIIERIVAVLKLFDRINPELLNYDSHFINDLGLDEIDVQEIMAATEDEFGVELPDEPLVYTPRALAELVDSVIN